MKILIIAFGILLDDYHGQVDAVCCTGNLGRLCGNIRKYLFGRQQTWSLPLFSSCRQISKNRASLMTISMHSSFCLSNFFCRVLDVPTLKLPTEY